jgi:hypothetical protein
MVLELHIGSNGLLVFKALALILYKFTNHLVAKGQNEKKIALGADCL